MIGAQASLLLQSSMERAQQQRAAAQQHQQAVQIQGAKLKATATTTPAAKKASSAKATSPTDTINTASISPYLTGDQLIGVGNAEATAENADTAARTNFMNSAATAMQQSGDAERGRVQNVANANDDAAARGIYDSGIRAGNVGMANTAAARAQAQLQGGLHMAAATAIQQRNAAKQQLAQYLQGAATQSAENGASLPTDPYTSSTTPGINVKGTPTTAKGKSK